VSTDRRPGSRAARPTADVDPVIRPAEPGDLPRAAPIYRLADADHAHLRDDAGPEAREIDAAAEADLVVAFAHHPEDVWVAEAAGEVVGFAAATVRGRHWYLSYLFVRPEWQGAGIGSRLLRAIHASGVRRGCDVFSTAPSADPRAVAAYLRLGMVPAMPALVLEATEPAFPPLPWGDDLEAVAFGSGDEAAIATVGDIDAFARGVRRPEDHLRWLEEGARGLLLLRREGATPAGYALLRPEPGETWRIGPAAALDADRVDDVVTRALHAASKIELDVRRWRVAVPGENREGLARLLAARFRPARLAPMLASGPIGRWDRYLFGDLDVL